MTLVFRVLRNVMIFASLVFLDVARFLGGVVSFDSCQVGFPSDATRLGELLENVGLSPATTEA